MDLSERMEIQIRRFEMAVSMQTTDSPGRRYGARRWDGAVAVCKVVLKLV